MIRNGVHDAFGSGAKVWLFGSRVCDERRGGDIDLLVRPDLWVTEGMLRRKVKFLTRLERVMGERKIDVVIEAPNDPRPIVRIAHEAGILL